jgi:hypothetical protein
LLIIKRAALSALPSQAVQNKSSQSDKCDGRLFGSNLHESKSYLGRAIRMSSREKQNGSVSGCGKVKA